MKEQYCVIAIPDNHNHTTLGVIPFKDDLKWFYEKIGCEHIEIPRRKIGERYYYIIVDDEGLLKQKPVCLVSQDRNEILVGNALICDAEGEDLVGLAYEECIRLIDTLVNEDGYTF